MSLYCACGVNKQHLPVARTASTCPFGKLRKRLIMKFIVLKLEFVVCTIRLIDSVLWSGPLDESLLSDSYKPHVLPTGCFACGTWMVFSPVCLSRILPSG